MIELGQWRSDGRTQKVFRIILKILQRLIFFDILLFRSLSRAPVIGPRCVSTCGVTCQHTRYRIHAPVHREIERRRMVLSFRIFDTAGRDSVRSQIELARNHHENGFEQSRSRVSRYHSRVSVHRKKGVRRSVEEIGGPGTHSRTVAIPIRYEPGDDTIDEYFRRISPPRFGRLSKIGRLCMCPMYLVYTVLYLTAINFERDQPAIYLPAGPAGMSLLPALYAGSRDTRDRRAKISPSRFRSPVRGNGRLG